MSRHTQSIALLIVLVSIATGCSTVEVANHLSRSKRAATEVPAKCLCLWQQTEGQRADGRTVRGFGGQVYFFPAEGDKPIAVDGSVQVFLFDDFGTPEDQARPVYETTFTAAEWNSMQSLSQFGPVYNLYVPYPRRGNYEANCTLRVGLTRQDGSRVFSDMASVKLAGIPRMKEQPVDRAVDPRREQQWVPEQRVVNADRTVRSETIGVRRGDQFIATAGHSTSAGRDDQNLADHADSSPTEDRDSRVRYYEEKLESLLKQRRSGQTEQRRASDRQIQQMSYEQQTPPRDSGNPFLDFAE